MTRLFTLVLSTLLAAPLGAQSVIVVDDDGGADVDFTALQPAIGAASPGDVVLIREGAYSPVSVTQALSLVADAGQAVQVGGVLAHDIAGGELALQGLTLGSIFSVPLDLRDVAGPVWVQDCTLNGGVALPDVNDGWALSVSSCQAVTLESCSVHGGILQSGVPLPAARVSASDLILIGTTIQGDDGDEGMPLLSPPEPGGDALVVTSGSTVHSESSSLLGGAGGDHGIFCQGEDGGVGVRLLGGSTLRVVDSTIAGGAGGTSSGSCPPGASGADVVPDPGTTVLTFGDTPRGLDATAVVREQEDLGLAVTGEPGDLVLLAIGAGSSPLILGSYATPLLVSLVPQPAVVPLGFVPSVGPFEADIPIGELGTGVEAIGLLLQVGVLDAQGAAFLGGARRVLLLSV